MMHRTLTIAFLAFIAMSLPACDKGGGEKELCEVGCRETYIASYNSCASTFRDCAVLCTGFSDAACLQACYTSFSDTCIQPALDAYEACTGTCSCTSAYNACVTPCSGDATCIEACMPAYETCLGYDTSVIGACIEGCYDTAETCATACQTTFADNYTGYLDCTYECSNVATVCDRACY